MILAADIGNSNISIGIYHSDGRSELSFTVACDLHKSADEYAIVFKSFLDLSGFSLSGISGSVIGSVVPDLTDTVSRALFRLTGIEPLIVGPGIKTSLDIKTDRPGEVGADIVANAVAALKEFTPPFVIFDFGTATTVLSVNENRQLTDVFILPGVRSSFNALIRDTATIASIPFAAPKALSGKNTASSVNAGIIYANAFAVDGFLHQIKKTGKYALLQAIATGGAAETVLPFCKHDISFRPHLTVDGLYHIYQKNCTN